MVLFPLPYTTEKTIPYIRERLKNGSFSPLIDREYPLEEISKAYSYVMTGEKIGNVVVNIS
jgi:NADPH:quinone reductase-like Zn-dependent oxidoreductase